MTDAADPVAVIRGHLAPLYPDLDTAGFGLTGRVLRLARLVEDARAEHLVGFGLTPGDFDVLATIRRTAGVDGVNPRTLLDAVLITSGGLTKRLDRLEAAGWIGRHPDPDDRRGTRVRLTDAGGALVDEALPSLLARERASAAVSLTDRQLEQLSSLLQRVLVAGWPGA